MLNFHGIMIDGLEPAAAFTRSFQASNHIPGTLWQINYHLSTGQLRWFVVDKAQILGNTELGEVFVCTGSLGISLIAIAEYILSAIKEEACSLLEHLIVEEEIPYAQAVKITLHVFRTYFPATSGYLTYDRMVALGCKLKEATMT